MVSHQPRRTRRDRSNSCVIRAERHEVSYQSTPSCYATVFFIQQAGTGPKTRKRKPLFLQLETTKAFKKLKIEKKISEFFSEIFLKFPVSRIVPKNVKGGTFWDFLNIHSVAKYQKLMGGTIKKIGKKSVSQCRKRRKVS